MKITKRLILSENKKFAKMSKARKRMQIARDVLAQLKLKRLVATEGYWLQPNVKNIARAPNIVSSKDFKKNLELQEVLKKQESCTGCALGGLFMCAVERANQLKVKELRKDPKSDPEKRGLDIKSEDLFRYLSRFFSEEQLQLIEVAFEQGQGLIRFYENGDYADDMREVVLDRIEFSSAEDYAKFTSSPEERMKLIMQNIIVNKGTFVPGLRPVAVSWGVPGFKGS